MWFFRENLNLVVDVELGNFKVDVYIDVVYLFLKSVSLNVLGCFVVFVER